MSRAQSDLSVWAEKTAMAGLLASAAVASIGLALKETAILVAILAWLIHKSASRTAPLSSAAWPLGLWFLAGIISVAHTVNMHASVQGLLKMLKIIGIVLVAADCIRTKPRLEALVAAMLIGASLICVDAFVQGLRGYDIWRHFSTGEAPGGLRRLTAGYGHANDLAAGLVSMFPACLAVALSDLRVSYRRWAQGLVLALSAIFVLTFSRSGALGLAVGLFVFCVVRRAWKTLAGLTVFAAVGWMNLPAPIKAWVAEQPSWIYVLVQPLRLEIWQAAINMIKAHPVIGVGVNTFVLNYAHYKIPSDAIQASYAHNQYLHMAAEIGLLGLAMFAWLLTRTFGVWRRLLAHPDADVRLMAVGLGCGLVAFCVIGLLESALYSSRFVYVWLWMGTLFGMATTGSGSGTIPVPATRNEQRSSHG